MECSIFYLIDLCVDFCISDCFPVDFNTDDLLCTIRCADTDCPGSAVSIEDGFVSRELAQVNGRVVKNFCLSAVDLIKRPRRDAESLAAKQIFDVAGAVNDFFLRSENGTGLTGIGIQHDRCDIGMEPE